MGVATNTHSSTDIHIMLKPLIPLVVLVGTSSCLPQLFLGYPGYSHQVVSPGYSHQVVSPGYSHQVVSPSLAPLRTALDVLHPSYGYGYPLGVSTSHTASPIFSTVFPTIENIETVEVVDDTENGVEVVDDTEDGVDVAAEIIEEEDSPSIVTIKENISSLPSPSPALFRDPSGPPIPAGIVQATQPKFVQVLFKNPKLSPHLSFISNSKTSPVLQEIKEVSAGITIV